MTVAAVTPHATFDHLPTWDEFDAQDVRLPAGVDRRRVYNNLAAATAAKKLDWSNPLTWWQIKYRFDCTRFVREVFGTEPDDWQIVVMDAAGDGKRKIAVRSGHGVGKTALASWVVIWWQNCFYPSKSVLTAPAAGTMEDGIGAEVKMWIKRLPAAIQSLFNVKGERIELNADKDGSFLTMRTSRPENPQSIAGIHAPHVCIVVDEASALADISYETVGSSMSAPHALMLLIGNPTLRGGYFFDCFHKMKDEWFCVHIASTDSPRVSPEYPKEIERRHGKNSNTYRIRVEGNFPLGNDDSVIPGGAAEAAVGRKVAPLVVNILWGLDVARSLQRDSSTLVKRKGNTILPVDQKLLTATSLHTAATLRWQFDDTARLIGVVKAEWDNTPETLRPQVICVDGIGFGAVVADVLRSMGLPAIAVNVSERLPTNSTYVNLKAELWFAVRDWFMAQTCTMPADTRLIEELCVVNYKHTPNGQIIIQDKDSIRVDHGFSPDGADALVLTFAVTPAMATPGQGRATSAWNQPMRRNVGGLV